MYPWHFALTMCDDRQDTRLRLIRQLPSMELGTSCEDGLSQRDRRATGGIKLMDMVRLIEA